MGIRRKRRDRYSTFCVLHSLTICSFRVFNLMWIREGGRIRLRRMSIAGTGGQCLMGPPDLKDGKMPVMLYNFGGAIFNLLFAVLALGLSFLYPPFPIRIPGKSKASGSWWILPRRLPPSRPGSYQPLGHNMSLCDIIN